MSTVRLLLLLPVVTCWFGLPALADPGSDGFRKLKAAEIRRAFSGHVFSDDVHFSFRYTASGAVEGTGMGAKVSRKWRVVKDELCQTDTYGETCYAVWKKGRAVRLIIGDQDLSLDGNLE